jgi:hypothetical protein
MAGKLILLWVACCFAAAGGDALSATTTIYKCFDRKLTVLYSDQPCPGEQMDIKTNDADPAALAELQHEREALARSIALRIADNRRAALERTLVAAPVYPAQEDFGAYDGGAAYLPYGYAGVPPARPKRIHAAAATGSVKQAAKARAAPIPPRVIPPR